MRRVNSLKLLICLLPLLVSGGHALRADDAWEIGRDDLFANLATAVSKAFPRLGADDQYASNARASTDWCFADEADPITNWWSFSYCRFYAQSAENGSNPKLLQDAQCNTNNNNGYYKSLMKDYSSDHGVRFKLIYQHHPNYYKNPASVFFALDLLKTSDYANENLVHALNDENPTPIGTAARSSILFPDDNCPQLKDFLQVMFPSYIPDWKPVVDPLCSTVPCGQHNIGGEADGDKILVDNIQIGLATKAKPLFWRFNNRTHTISGAMRFLITFKPCDAAKIANNTCGPYDGKYGFLWIGYGGSGGAG
jgi:hypothetical protein